MISRVQLVPLGCPLYPQSSNYYNDSLKRLAADPIEASEGELHRHFRAFRDYFDLPAALISARIIDLGTCRMETDRWKNTISGSMFMPEWSKCLTGWKSKFHTSI